MMVMMTLITNDPIIIDTKHVKFSSDIVRQWYYSDEVKREFLNCRGYKFLSFMKYNGDGTTTKPHRWNWMVRNTKSYRFVLARNYIGYKPVSVYRDVDNWKPIDFTWSNDYDEKKKQQKEWSDDGKYKRFMLNADFVIDIDGKSPIDTWDSVNKILQLYNKFNVMYSVYCSGKKGWTIIVPGHKAILKEKIQVSEDLGEYNTHYALALDIMEYLGIEKELDLSSFWDLRFIKQPYSLDGRNMRPIIPLTYTEFIFFKKLYIQSQNTGQQHPYLTTDYWLSLGISGRGMSWNNTGNMLELEKFLDKELGGDDNIG